MCLLEIQVNLNIFYHFYIRDTGTVLHVLLSFYVTERSIFKYISQFQY